MKTQRVSALEMLKHPLPAVVKGVNGVYEIIKVTADDINVTCYRNGRQGGKIPALRKRFDGVFEVIVTESSPNHLLDTIGALHTRNKGLQKGHATLTRRVQELEAELAAEKERGVSVMTEQGMGVYNKDGKCRLWMGVLDTKTHPFLDQNIVKKAADKVLSDLISQPNHRFSDRAIDAIIADVLKDDSKHLEKLKPNTTAADHQLQHDINVLTARVRALEEKNAGELLQAGDAIHEVIDRMLQPGGLLYRCGK